MTAVTESAVPSSRQLSSLVPTTKRQITLTRDNRPLHLPTVLRRHIHRSQLRAHISPIFTAAMYATLVSLAAGAKDAGFDWTPAWTLGGVVATGLFLLAGHGMVQRAARKQAAIQADRDLRRHPLTDQAVCAVEQGS